LSSASTQLPAVVTAAYDAANEQVQFGNPLPPSPNLTYDANGNLTNDGTNTYTWDARNRLTAISGGVSASFTYDALGRRTSKTITGVTTQFQYDGNDIVQESGPSGVVAYLRSLNIDEPFVRQSSSNEYYHTDALGSVLTLTGQTGAVQTTYNYEAFGKTTITGTSTNPFQYTGRENDGTGLSYYRARYYSQVLERFVSEDPLLKNTGDKSNLYLYVDDDPTNRADPLGLFPVPNALSSPCTIKYNAPSPQTQPIHPAVESKVCCLQSCLGTPLVITGGSEPGIGQGKHKSPAHAQGLAADFGFGANPDIKDKKDKFFCCAKKCGFLFGITEGPGTAYPSNAPQFHLSAVPGGPGFGPGFGGSSGQLPAGTCACK
jgi:RHS repeat-associated protein